MNEWQRKTIEHALQLRAQPEEASKALNDFNEKQNDWFAFCPICKTKIVGTLKDMRAHTHDPAA
jgi:hypothetical protein